MTQVTMKSLVEEFFDMEDDLRLFHQQSCGVNFWEFVRLFVFQRIREGMGLSGQALDSVEPSLRTRVDAGLRAAANLFFRNPYLAPQEDILFVGHPRRKLHADGKWWDIYCDPIIEELGTPSVYLESSYLGRHLSPAKTPGIRYLDLPYYLKAVKQRLQLDHVSLTRNDVRLLESIEREIGLRFKVSIDLCKHVQQRLHSRKIALRLLRSLVERIAPRVVIVVVSEGKGVFIEACKQLGIPVVELQHGNISGYSIVHSFPGSQEPKLHYPDHLFVFGDYWKQAAEFPIPRERVHSVGFPYLERGLAEYSGIEKKEQVLFISQGTIGSSLSQLAVATSARSDFPFEVVYKLHPGEYRRWRQEYPWLMNSRLRVVDDDSIPLYKLLAESRMLVGVYSTAILEGLCFGVRPVLMNAPGIEVLSQLVEQGVAVVASSVDELVEAAREQPVVEDVRDQFLKKGAIVNIKSELEDIMGAVSLSRSKD